MPTHVALLRGINVGARNRVAMADLRGIAEHLGVRPTVVVLTRAELAQVGCGQPLPRRAQGARLDSRRRRAGPGRGALDPDEQAA